MNRFGAAWVDPPDDEPNEGCPDCRGENVVGSDGAIGEWVTMALEPLIAALVVAAQADAFREGYHHGVDDMTGTETLTVVRRNPYLVGREQRKVMSELDSEPSEQGCRIDSAKAVNNLRDAIEAILERDARIAELEAELADLVDEMREAAIRAEGDE